MAGSWDTFSASTARFCVKAGRRWHKTPRVAAVVVIRCANKSTNTHKDIMIVYMEGSNTLEPHIAIVPPHSLMTILGAIIRGCAIFSLLFSRKGSGEQRAAGSFGETSAHIEQMAWLANTLQPAMFGDTWRHDSGREAIIPSSIELELRTRLDTRQTHARYRCGCHNVTHDDDDCDRGSEQLFWGPLAAGLEQYIIQHRHAIYPPLCGQDNYLRQAIEFEVGQNWVYI